MAEQPSWYAVAVYREYRTRDELADMGLEIWLPECIVEKTLRRAIVKSKGPLFPGYLFVRVRMDAYWQEEIESARGVYEIVCGRESDRPLALNEAELGKLQADIARSGGRILIRDGRVARGYDYEERAPFAVGQSLRITEGPFASHNAIYEAPAATDRIKVLLDIMGRPTVISVDEASVEALA